jgi:hypothetical protein
MFSLRGALVLSILVLAGLGTAAAEPLGAPAEGVLVLRSGQALKGRIERLGDNYVVHVAARAKVHLPMAEVDLVCHSLEEAYQKKREYIAPDSATGHLDLAEWCLKHGLQRRAAEQLSAAMSADPEEPRIPAVERRLREALAAPPALRTGPAKVTPVVHVDDLEETMRSVSAAAVERFTSAVQPVLLNRCSTSSCHGATSKSSFKLLRPAAGDPITRRYTQRNLHAVLKTIDKAAPEASPLLTVPRAAHGSAAAAVFGQRDERQFEQLVQWVKQAAEPGEVGKAGDLATLDSRLRETAEPPPPRTSYKPPVSSDSRAPIGKPERPNSEKPSVKNSASKPFNDGASLPDAKFDPRDPFDPELFNRKYLEPKERP